jgi:hypothetical protein
MKNIVIFLIASLLFTGCKLAPKPLDSTARSQQVSAALVNAEQINIVPVSINGAKPPREAFAFALKKLKKYTTENITVHPMLSLTLDSSQINDFIFDYAQADRLERLKPEEIAAFCKATEKLPRDETTIMMIYTPVLYDDRSRSSRPMRGLAFYYHPDRQPFNVVAYNQTKIDNAPVISKNQAWKIVLTHILGYRLGVPARKSHNSHNRCTSRECVMYAAPDWQAVASVALNGMPYDFCDLCKEELKEAKELQAGEK